MGCMCSLPSIDFEQSQNIGKSPNSTLTSSKSIFRRNRSTKGEIPTRKMDMVELLERCFAIVEENFKGSIDPITIAAIVIMESSAVSDLQTFREYFQENAYGLGQMLPSTAQFLIESGYSKHPIYKPEDLFDPKIALYFVCAYVDYLIKQRITGKNEEFLIKAYHNGSLHMKDVPQSIWDVYLKAKSQLLRLNDALTSPESKEIIHVVQPGETFEVIGRICGVSVEAIMEVNPDVKDIHSIQTGDCIEIPVKKLLPRLYAVKAGDSLATIARNHDVSLFRLLNANSDLKNPSSLTTGWLLSIPGLKGNSAELNRRKDLISARIEDEPFFLSSFADRHGIRIEEDMFAESMVRGGHLRHTAQSRGAMRKLFGTQKRPNPK